MINKEKTKKIISRVLWIVWSLIGISLLFVVFFMYNKMYSITGLGIIAWVILFTLSLYAAIIYFGATLLFLFIKWIIKKIKNKKRGKKK